MESSIRFVLSGLSCSIARIIFSTVGEVNSSQKRIVWVQIFM